MPQVLNSDLLDTLRCCAFGNDPRLLESQEDFVPYLPKPFYIIIDETTNKLLKIQE